MSQPQNIFSCGEYNSLIVKNGKAWSETTGTLLEIPTSFVVTNLWSGLHTQYLGDSAGNAYSYDDASKTVSANPIATNVQFIAGNPSGAGPAILFKDGTLSINGAAISFPSTASAIVDVWLTANGSNYAVDSNGVAYNCTSGEGVVIPLPAPVKMMCANTWSAHFLLNDGQLYAYGPDYRYYGYTLGQLPASPTTPIRVDQRHNFPAPIVQISSNYNCTHAILADKSLWGWGENTSGTVGNGQETNMTVAAYPYSAPWYNSPAWNLPPSQGGALFVPTAVQVGKGIQWAFINRGCYNMYSEGEDTNGTIYTWGRNKSYVLMNGIGGNSDQQANQPNLWDVLVPTAIHPFGTVVVPPVNQSPLAAIARVAPVTLPLNVITLDGSTSVDPDGTIASYAWSQVGGPLSAFLGTGSKIQAILTVAGTYTFQLTVTDNNGASTSVQLSVVVNPVPACPQIPAPRTVTDLKLNQFGLSVDVPLQYAQFGFSDGGKQ